MVARLSFSPPLRGPVVDDHDRGREGADEDGVVAAVGAVVVRLVDVHRAHPVDRADEPPLDVPGEVAAVEEAEGPELEEHHHAVGVVARVGLLLGGSARRPRRSAGRDRARRTPAARRGTGSAAAPPPTTCFRPISSPGFTTTRRPTLAGGRLHAGGRSSPPPARSRGRARRRCRCGMSAASSATPPKWSRW